MGTTSPSEFLTGQGRNAATYIQESVAASNLANNLSAQGLNSGEIAQLLDSAGFVPTAITDALDSLAVVSPVAVSTPVTDGVTVTSPATPAVTVTAPKTTGMTTQEVINLVESQLAANKGTAPTNLANVQITGDRPATTQEIVNAITATIPNVTAAQAQTLAEQVITSGKQVTTQELANAVSATIPALTQTTPVATQTITGQKPITTQEVINAITASIPNLVTPDAPRLTITADRPSSIIDTVTAAVTPTTPPTTTTPTTTTDPLKVAQLALAAAGLLGAGSKLSTTTPTTFPVVPVPPEWTSPTKGVAPYTPLPPIDFGNRNLLRGTQWEKFLNPNYGKVPAPVQYSQPSRLSYNDLMGILGSKQGMPPASALSINDVISGIQNQYGQTPTSTMG